MTTTHEVKKGETLSRIGTQYGIDWRGITGFRSGDPNLIYPGEVLTIPEPTTAGPEGTIEPTILTPPDEIIKDDTKKLNDYVSDGTTTVNEGGKVSMFGPDGKEIVVSPEQVETMEGMGWTTEGTSQISPEEKEFLGLPPGEEVEIPEGEDPQVTALKKEITDLTAQWQTTMGDLDALRTSMRDATGNLIGSIKDKFGVRRAQMEDINRRSLAQLTTYGIRMGGARYAPTITQGILSAEERAGITRLAEIDALESQAIAEAQQAMYEQDYAMLHDKLTMIDDIRNQKIDVMNDMIDKINEQNEKIAEEAEILERQSNIISLVNSGITNPGDIAQLMGYNLNEVGDALDILIDDKKESGWQKLDSWTNEAEGKRYVAYWDPISGTIMTQSIGTDDKGESYSYSNYDIDNAARSILDRASNIWNFPNDVRFQINNRLREIRDEGYTPHWLVEKMSDTQLKDVIAFDTSVASWERVKQLSIEVQNLIGPTSFGAYTGTFSDLFAQYNSPKLATLKAEVDKAFQLYRKETTGAQASDKEIAMLRPNLPELTDTPTVFFNKLDETINGTRRAKGVFMGVLEKGSYDISAFVDEEITIKVKLKSTGETGTIPEDEFDENLYEKLE